ncbi:hypothetical protein H8E65_02530 [Candidatus Bathyarchaeota archaeon]|nr:hypothetical protein [Candidatus Bathyarchaeota archaeon]MBL7078744.1 hypothetical protein [Candidatus Bathyarchaeota archaeon]
MATDDMDALESQASALFEKRDGFNKERETRIRERDRFNESVKELQAKARNAKAERDGVNARVAELKGRLGGLRERLEAKREAAGEIHDENDESRGRLRPRWRLLEELREIEWELSTTPTLEIKDREAELIERAKHLKTQVEEHRKLDTRDDMYLMSLADSNAVGMEIRKIREEMDGLRETGQEHHERMLAFYRQADEERKRSDEAHKKFVEALESLREVNAELDKIIPELKKIRKLSQDEARFLAEKRNKVMAEKKKELAEEARLKLEAGEKLSLDEMKLIYGEE